MQRLQELIPRLREADARLNEAIERIECAFWKTLPEDAYGCLLLSYEHGVWTHLLYSDGALWIETWSERHGFHCEDAVGHDIRANRIEAVRRFEELWALCLLDHVAVPVPRGLVGRVLFLLEAVERSPEV